MQFYEIAAMIFGMVLGAFALFVIALNVYCFCFNFRGHMNSKTSSEATACTEKITGTLHRSTKREKPEKKEAKLRPISNLAIV